MAENAIQHLDGQVPATPLALKFIEEAYRLNVVLKRFKPVFYAQFGKKPFSVMAEGRVADIVAKGNGLDKIFIEMQEATDSPGNSGHQLDVQDPVGYMVVGDE